MGISPALIAAGVGAVGSIGSAAIGANASSDAAKQQANAANQASQTQMNIYNQTRGDLAPYTQTGTSALAQLQAMLNGNGTGPGGNAFSQLQSLLGLGSGGVQGAMSTLQNLPGYQFSLNQGQQALDRSAASRGLLLSGAQLKDSQQFGQGLAQQNYGNYVSQLQNNLGQNFISPLENIAQLGENAGAQTGGIGSAAGQGIAQSQLAAGQAQASGTVGSANAIMGGLQSGLNNSLLAYQLYNQGNNAVGSYLDQGVW